MQGAGVAHRDKADAAGNTPGPKPAQRRISSRSLFSGAHELVIEHQGEHYRLRVTRNGKLILTK